jgi:nitrogen regulatory protein P-II 2
MKILTAIIRQHKLEDVREKLDEIGVKGITICEVKGYGNQKGHVENYRGAQYLVDYIPKLKIDVALTDELVESAIKAIIEGAKTGATGDGKIFVRELEQVVRIRTGETGEQAL